MKRSKVVTIKWFKFCSGPTYKVTYNECGCLSTIEEDGKIVFVNSEQVNKIVKYCYDISDGKPPKYFNLVEEVFI